MEKKSKSNSDNIEKLFADLEKIVTKMESEDNSLEINFELYKKGCDICKVIKEKVDKVEQKFIEVQK